MTEQSKPKGFAWAPGAFVFVLVMCLVYATGSAKKANERAETSAQQAQDAQAQIDALTNKVGQAEARVAWLEYEMGQKDEAYAAALVGAQEKNDALTAALRRCRGDHGHDTPIFAPEWTH